MHAGLRHRLRPVPGRLGAFRTSIGGATAPIFALAFLPVALSVGAAVDYGYATRVKAQLDAAADAAALAAVNKSAIQGEPSAAQAIALDMFNLHAAGVKSANLGSVDAVVSDAATGRTAVVSYSASVPTAFMGLVGIDKMPIGGSVTAVSNMPGYVDFYLLLDNTPSMGVGATTADINTMVANTPDKCAFACHDLSAAPNDYYHLAKKLNVQMRIDTVREATAKLADTASGMQSKPGQYRMALYTFGTDAKHLGLRRIRPITASLSAAKAAAHADIDLMSIPYQNYAGDTQTDFHDVLGAMNAEIPDPGDGSKSSSPAKVLFFVSDGVANRALGSPTCTEPTVVSTDPKTKVAYTRCQEPIDVALCTAIKKRGIRIAVLYTSYLPLPTNAWYNKWIAPFSPKIAANMEACASPGLFFEVSPSEGIAEAMVALFQRAAQQARLSK
jgi:Flp pilus assembly protein TadG